MKLPLAIAIAFTLSTPVFASDNPAKEARQASKQAREDARAASQDAFDSDFKSWEDGGEVGPRPRRSQY